VCVGLGSSGSTMGLRSRAVVGFVAANNEMNLTNRGVPGTKERPASGEPVLAEVGRPVILSLGIAGYFSVMRHGGRSR
jgi:hypothetical protein